MVVARFLDGRVIKGTTQDFAPLKTRFHLFPWGDEVAKPLDIPTGALKALFFVKSYDGDPERIDLKLLDNTLVLMTVRYPPAEIDIVLVEKLVDRTELNIALVERQLLKTRPRFFGCSLVAC